MKFLKPLLIATVSLFTLSGCIASNLVGVDDTVFVVDLVEKSNISRDAPIYIARIEPQSIAQRCNKPGYILWGSTCYLDKYIPEKIDIKYAKWKPYNQIPKPSYPHMVEFANSLPASAWQIYTVYPKQVVAQIKSGKNAQGEPLLPSAIAEKKITLSLVIDENGNITMKDNYGYSTEIYDIR